MSFHVAGPVLAFTTWAAAGMCLWLAPVASVHAETGEGPVEVCRSVGTMDPAGLPLEPDGPPAWIEQALGGGPVVWRCVSGKVLACVQRTSTTCRKLDVSDKPNAGMRGYCQKHPNAQSVARAYVPTTSVYQWRCVGSRPVADGRTTILPSDVDARGFRTSEWRQVAPSDAHSKK